MRKLRLKYYIIVLLATLSLTSVGFASWMINESSTSVTNGMIVVDDVLKVNDYITCNNVVPFKYFTIGFVMEDNSLSNIGTITVDLSINVDECKNKFINCDTIEVELDMFQENLNNFDVENKISLESKVMNGIQEIVSEHAIGTTLSITKFDLNLADVEGTINITVTYTFTIEDIDYFKNNIYPLLVEEDFNFKISAKLTGKEVVN